MEGNESFDASSLGTADEVVEERVAGKVCNRKDHVFSAL
jgi:hypothetical protein